MRTDPLIRITREGSEERATPAAVIPCFFYFVHGESLGRNPVNVKHLSNEPLIFLAILGSGLQAEGDREFGFGLAIDHTGVENLHERGIGGSAA